MQWKVYIQVMGLHKTIVQKSKDLEKSKWNGLACSCYIKCPNSVINGDTDWKMDHGRTIGHTLQ